MQPKNATLARFFLLAVVAQLCAGSILLIAKPQAAVASALHFAPAAIQLQSANPLPYPFLTPTDTGSIALSTHIAELVAIEDGNGGTIIHVTAQFHFKNSVLTPAATVVRISSPISGTVPADLAVTIDDQPAGVYVPENGGLALNIELAAEAMVDVTLTYSLVLPPTALQAIAYPLALLSGWQRRISSSVRITLPTSVASQSVVQISPDDWIFPSDGGQAYSVRWLFDGLPPEQPFALVFIEPILWQQIEAARAALTAGFSADSLRLGDLYSTLLAATDDDLRAGFYAQALAAYADGLQRSSDPSLSADLQRRLAQLYRSQIVTPNGAINSDYAQLTVQAADRALTAIPNDDARRSELTQWRSDALSVLFNEARQRNDWSTARQLLDQFDATGDQAGDSKFVADGRRRLVVQQALQLLEDGNRQAAITLAGQEIGAAELRAPDELTSLFESWQVTLTLALDGTVMDWIGLPVAEREQAAAAALQELIAAWNTRSATQGYEFTLTRLPAPSNDQRQPVHLHITMPAAATGLPLAEATPLRTDWALFRTLLAQLALQNEQTPTFLRQQILLYQTLDLRSVADQWNAMASNLEQRAAVFETQAAAAVGNSDADAEAALRARIQLSNYRGAAKVWASMARNSSIALTLAANRQASEQRRTWLLTPVSAAQSLEFAATIVNWGRVLAAIGAALFLLFLAAGVLWWLL